MNNYRFRYNNIVNPDGTNQELGVKVLVSGAWDLNGVNDSIDKFENEIIQQVINPIQDVETIRYAHKPWVFKFWEGLTKSSTNYDFYFYSATTDSSVTATTDDSRWVMDYRANGYTDSQIYYNEGVFSKSYFKLDFYDTKKTTRQQIYLTIIIPTQQGEKISTQIGQSTVQIRKPKFILDHVGDKEGYYYYWLKNKDFLDIETLYMSCKYYDASLGQFKRMTNTSQGEFPNKFNFSQEDYFYYKVNLDYENFQYEIYSELPSKFSIRVGTESNPIKWYEYINP